jgi:UDP-GlcNAc:undecaprenyl-phosphate GlcNAc-1-phosphate transferase
MVQRVSEGRSPFSADRNHIHHKLLALGFRHHEAVMVIYAVQSLLFVAAYFLRYESDILIVCVVSGFFALSIGLLQVSQRSGWRVRQADEVDAAQPGRRFTGILEAPTLLPRLSYFAIAIGVGGYASLIVAAAASIAADFRILIVALLAVVVGFLAVLRRSPLSIIEKGVVYVTATVLVYLDAVVLPPDPLLDTIGWIAVSIAALATAARLRLYNDRTFQLTPLDLIVLFMALVVPSLLGSLQLSNGSALAIAKLVVLFYALEMLVSRSEHRAVWVRLSAASVLAGLAVRSFMSV